MADPPSGGNTLKEIARQRKEATAELRRKMAEAKQAEEAVAKDHDDEGGEEGGATFKPTAPVFSFAGGRPVPPAVFGLSLPDGWAECPNFGVPIRGLIPSKVPLAARFCDRLPPELRYGPKEALAAFAAHGASVGLVVDLTFTTRYTDPAEWAALGVRYAKVACRGREGPPDPEAVNTFCYLVSCFEASEATAAAAEGRRPKYVLIHCTHGFNRTGAMIAHYIMRAAPTAPEGPYPSLPTVLEQFATVRPPGIYKEDYISMLFRYYHERRPPAAACPPLPAWKAPDAPAAGSGAVADDDVPADDLFGAGNAEYKRTPAVSPFPPPWAADEPAPYMPPPAKAAGKDSLKHEDEVGERISPDEEAELQWALTAVLAPPAEGAPPPSRHNRPAFPGSQPVSLAASNIPMLGQRKYLVSWKADGTRYLLLLMRRGTYLVDRTFAVRRVQMRFPQQNKAPHEATLLDGEMVVDYDGASDSCTRRFLAYDLMCVNGQTCVSEPYARRWERLESEVLGPRAFAEDRAAKQPERYAYDYKAEPFRTRRKDFWPLSRERIQKVLATKYPHETDGLIFQCAEEPYVPRTCEELLKWKPADLNSVDFVVRPSARGATAPPELLLLESGREADGRERLRPLEGASLELPLPEGIELASIANCVVECGPSKTPGRWRFLRVRRDKATPNHVSVYARVQQSIDDDITTAALLARVGEMVRPPEPAGPPAAKRPRTEP